MSIQHADQEMITTCSRAPTARTLFVRMPNRDVQRTPRYMSMAGEVPLNGTVASVENKIGQTWWMRRRPALVASGVCRVPVPAGCDHA